MKWQASTVAFMTDQEKSLKRVLSGEYAPDSPHIDAALHFVQASIRKILAEVRAKRLAKAQSMQ